MMVRSRRGVAIGVVIVLAVPIAFLLLAVLVQNGIAPYEPIHAQINGIGLIGWVSLAVLGPVGIAIAGWSAGVRGVLAWLAVVIVFGPMFVALWLMSVVTISGSLGNPA